MLLGAVQLIRLQQQLAAGIDVEAQAQAVFSPAPWAGQGQGWGGCGPGFHPRLAGSPSVQHGQTIYEHHLRALLGQRFSQHNLQFLLVVLAAGQHHFQGLFGGPSLAGYEQRMPAMLTGALIPATHGDSPGQHIPQGHSGGEGRAAPIAQLLRFAGRDLGASGQALRTARVIGKAGVALGGRDLDRWIASHLCPDAVLDPALLTVAEGLKCRLSEAEEALGLWVDPTGTTRELRLNRPRLEQLLVEKGLLVQLEALLDSVLAAARSEALAGPAIAAVLPVGGCSQLPPVSYTHLTLPTIYSV